MALSKKEYKKLLDHLDQELDADFEDALQATEKALEEGKDIIGRNEEKKDE